MTVNKKANRNTSNNIFCENVQHFLHKKCFQKVSRCGRAQEDKEMYKKVCYTFKVVVVIIVVVVFC